MGFGTDVVEWLLGEAGRLGMLSVYLLTERAAPFFERLGFVVTDRADAPPEILRTRQATVPLPCICNTAFAHSPRVTACLRLNAT
jgi:N-acetylglutamate synthase-like GNAT family acetyltransferase